MNNTPEFLPGDVIGDIFEDGHEDFYLVISRTEINDLHSYYEYVLFNQTGVNYLVIYPGNSYKHIRLVLRNASEDIETSQSNAK